MSTPKEHEFLPRDESFLAFNHRVLDWAKRADVPLLERLRYLCIVSSNLDEFFEVRMALHLRAVHHHDHKASFSSHSFLRLSELAHRLVDEQYALYNDQLLADFAEKGIKLLSHGERSLVQRRWVKQYFEQEVRPLLVPVGLDPPTPFQRLPTSR